MFCFVHKGKNEFPQWFLFEQPLFPSIGLIENNTAQMIAIDLPQTPVAERDFFLFSNLDLLINVKELQRPKLAFEKKASVLMTFLVHEMYQDRTLKGTTVNKDILNCYNS